MGTSLAGTLAAVGLLGTAAFVVVRSPLGYFLFGYGCGDEEDRLGEVLARESVLGARPKSAGEGEPYQGCDDDDLFVVAGTSYAYGGPRASVLAHYREAALAEGWRARAEDCFAKRINGTTAYLTVEGPTGGSLQVEIIADRDDGHWC